MKFNPAFARLLAGEMMPDRSSEVHQTAVNLAQMVHGMMDNYMKQRLSLPDNWDGATVAAINIAVCIVESIVSRKVVPKGMRTSIHWSDTACCFSSELVYLIKYWKPEQKPQ